MNMPPFSGPNSHVLLESSPFASSKNVAFINLSRVCRAPWRLAGCVRRRARDRLRVARHSRPADERSLPQPIPCPCTAPGGLGRSRRGALGDPARPTSHRGQPDVGSRGPLDRRLASAGARQPQRHRTGLCAPAWPTRGLIRRPRSLPRSLSPRLGASRRVSLACPAHSPKSEHSAPGSAGRRGCGADRRAGDGRRPA